MKFERKYDYDKIVKDYLYYRNIKEVAKLHGTYPMTIHRALLFNGIKHEFKLYKDFTSFVFDNWEVLCRDINKKSRKVYWLCKCFNCHSIKSFASNNLHTNNLAPCRECHNKISKYIYRYHWNQINGSAKRRNLDFLISPQFLDELYEKQNKLCALSGVPIYISSSNSEHRTGNTTASLDRINSKMGYFNGNVQWVHKDVNTVKFDLDQDTFFYFIDKINNPDNSYKEIKLYNRRNFYKGYGNINYEHWYSIKNASEKRGWIFDISIKDIWDLFLQQKGKCKITGIPLEFGENYRLDSKIRTASLDRINSNKGYTMDNIQWVHKTVNNMKWDFNMEYFLKLCNNIYNYKLSSI